MLKDLSSDRCILSKVWNLGCTCM